MAKDLYYLFPGSAKSKRKRQWMHLKVGLGVGLAAAGLVAALAYVM